MKGGVIMPKGRRGRCFHCTNVTLVWQCAECRRNYCPSCFDKEGKVYGVFKKDDFIDKWARKEEND